MNLTGLGLDSRDAAVFRQCPMLMAPVHGELPACKAGQRRLIAARDGVWLECKTPAIHFCGRVTATPLPYGEIKGFCRLVGGLVPRDLHDVIVRRSIEACPKEMACLVAWSHSDQRYRLIWPEVSSASAGHVTYSSWGDTNDLTLAVDVHSHGHGPARFSSVDDDSDRSIFEPHLSVVIGRCRPGEVEMSTRFCAGTYLIDLPNSPFDR
jgi:PRTRC genetic system protein A